MDSTLIAAALLSALLHAAWNAAVKASARPAQAMTAQMVAAGGIAALLLPWSGWPAAASLPWMALSTALSLSAVACLLRAYRHAAFGAVYPVSRAASVLLVVPLALAVAGERPTALGLAGVALVSVAVLALALRSREGAAMSTAGLRWTLAAAACTAGLAVSDAQGVRSAGSALAYGCLMSVASAVGRCWLERRDGSVMAVMAGQWRAALPMGVASMASYLLILWVWTSAPIALAAALRDTSAVFATLIAVLVLREPADRVTLAAVALATGGAVLIRLG